MTMLNLGVLMQIPASILFQSMAAGDWSVIASMLAILIGTGTIVGLLISKLVVKPMMDASEARVMARIDKLSEKMITREKFEDYERTDRREHDMMQKQLDAVFRRLNTTPD